MLPVSLLSGNEISANSNFKLCLVHEIPPNHVRIEHKNSEGG